MPFKIQIASDLHHEFVTRSSFPNASLITCAASADLLVLAGDIDAEAQGIARYAEWPVPVVYVAGNHEFYGRELIATRRNMRQAASGTNVVYMERTRHDIGSVRILGCTLWTDYMLDSGGSQVVQLEVAQRQLNDHRLIRIGREAFTSEHALEQHYMSRDWLEEQLLVPHEGATVVVTHHGPHPKSVHQRFSGDVLNGAFVSDLTYLMGHVDLWIHGHVHDSFDYTVGRCRVVANPRGYPSRDFAESEADMAFENSHFQRELVVEV